MDKVALPAEKETRSGRWKAEDGWREKMAHGGVKRDVKRKWKGAKPRGPLEFRLAAGY